MFFSGQDSSDDKVAASCPAYPGSKPVIFEFSNFNLFLFMLQRALRDCSILNPYARFDYAGTCAVVDLHD